MRQIHRLLLAAALLALPAAAQAQQTPPANRGGRMMQDQMQGRMQLQSPIQIFLDNKAQLRLTAEQVTQLEAIGAELEARNKPLREKMLEARGGAADGGRPSREERAEMRQKLAPIMQEMQKNNAAARDQIMDLLNAEQKKVARDLLEARRQDRRPGQGQGRGPRH